MVIPDLVSLVLLIVEVLQVRFLKAVRMKVLITGENWQLHPIMRSVSHEERGPVNTLTAGNTWVYIQYCGYWCSGAKAPGHQYPQCWTNVHCIGLVLDKTIKLIVNNIRKWNWNLKNNLPSCLMVNTMKLRQNGSYFADSIFRSIFLYEDYCISIQISVKSDPKGSLKKI